MELGNLEMIMRISRWHGVAPYSSLSTLEVSRGYVVYGIVLAFMYSCLFVTDIIRGIYTDWSNTHLASVGRATVIGTRMLSLLLILQTMLRAPRRLTHIKQSINNLNQINMKLNQKIGNGKGIYQSIIICCILIQFGACLAEHFINISSFDNIYLQIWIYLSIPLAFLKNTESIVIFQISCFMNIVLSTLAAINNKLENLRTERRSLCQFYHPLVPKLAWSNRKFDFSTSRKKQYADIFQREEKKKVNFLQSLRELGIHYSVICDIVRDTMQMDGILLCLLILYFFLLFLLNFGIVLFWNFFTKISIYHNIPVTFTLIWMFIHGTYFIILVEPFHRVFNEMQRTRVLVNSLKAAVIDDESEKNEVEIFQRLLLLIDVTFSPLYMFTINRSLILKILGGVLTYVVTCFTYGPEMKNPNFYLNQFYFKNATTF